MEKDVKGANEETYSISRSMSFSLRGPGDFNDPWSSAVPAKTGFWERTWDSFKPDPVRKTTRKQIHGVEGNIFDAESAAQNTATTPLARQLKGRHLQMIAIAGSIGWLNK
jgi:amino acid transporter